MYKTGDIRKYNGLQMSREVLNLLLFENDKFIKNSNGVGSPVVNKNSWLIVRFFVWLAYKITPNTVCGLDITDCSDLHDNEQVVPRKFSTLKEAHEAKDIKDEMFHENMIKRFEEHGGAFEELRKRRAGKYNYLLRFCGMSAFMKNKIIKEDYE